MVAPFASVFLPAVQQLALAPSLFRTVSTAAHRAFQLRSPRRAPADLITGRIESLELRLSSRFACFALERFRAFAEQLYGKRGFEAKMQDLIGDVKLRTNNMLKAGGPKARAQERELRAATKREINAVMERPARGTIETVPTGRGDDMEVITDPVAVAAECCEFGKRRMGSMQPKWFRRYDVAAEHEVWFSDGMTARRRRVTAIDDDGRYNVVDEEGDKHEQLKREQICNQRQLEEMDDTDGPDAAVFLRA